MLVLAIPDVHLKPWMFSAADRLLAQGDAEVAVCLGDLADDWGSGYDTSLYEQTYDAAIAFARRHPTTRWCWGNHDLSYRWQRLESGYSMFARDTVRAKLEELQRTLGDDNPIAYVQRVDNAIFSHAGVSEAFVRDQVQAQDPAVDVGDVDAVIHAINRLGARQMWGDGTPIWLRPNEGERLYRKDSLLHVVGHTPVVRPTEDGGALYTDTFSTYRDGRPIGSEEFVLIESETLQWRAVKADR